jgi:hypothetical protein
VPYVLKHRRPPEPWKEFRRRALHPILIPFQMTEFAAEWTAYFLSRWSFLEVLDYAGSFSVLVAVIFYFAESGARTRANHYQAWMVINSAHGQYGNGGRQDALQSLNDDHVSLVAVDISRASLPGVDLHDADLLRGNFAECDLRGAKFMHANLELADLRNANLREADLRGAVFRNANLSETDLTDANLDGASLEGANLMDADLSNIKNWDQIASMQGALIQHVDNAPDGFIPWAIQHGAITSPNPAAAPTTKRTTAQ